MSESKSTSKTREAVPSTVVCPMLSSTNYTVWAMRMKVFLRVHKVWESVEPGTGDEEKNDLATAFLFQSIPENLILQIGDQDSPKEIWEAVKSRNLGGKRVNEARLQTLMNEFERLKMKDTDSIDAFSAKLSELASRSAALGQSLEERQLVEKFLNSLPRSKYIQIIASLEQVLDLNKTSFEDIVERLKVYEERILEEDMEEHQRNLMFSNSEHSYSHGGYVNSRGKGRGRGYRGGRGYVNKKEAGM